MKKGDKAPITYRLFKNIHVDNLCFLKGFGVLMGVIFRLLKKKKYNEVESCWKKVNRSHGKSWYEFLGNFMIYGVSPEEYVCFKFYDLNDRGKREYVTDHSRHEIYNMCNDQDYVHFFENKFETYRILKKYYKRDALFFNETTTISELAGFVNKHERFVVKPLKLALGIGIEIFSFHDFKSLEDLKSYLVTKGECIIEELIEQSAYLGCFHKESVNTIRIPCFNTKKGVVVHRPFIKFGQGNSIVDNGGQGGILVALDAETGVLVSKGIDENGQVYLTHPDSGILFLGYQLPDWKQALEVVTECMRFVPEIKYVGWDLAHTEKGWVIVEGNATGQFVGQQMPLHSGCRKEIDNILIDL